MIKYILENLEFSKLIKDKGNIAAGLATDGDADRIGLYNSKGEFVDSHHIILLLLLYLNKYKKYYLLKKLKVTKQSLNRVLKDLIKLEAIFFKKDQQDNRIKHILLNENGQKIYEEIFSNQKKTFS